MNEPQGMPMLAPGVRVRALAVVAACVVAVTVAACDSRSHADVSLDDADAVAGVTTVQAEDNTFTPAVIEVPEGTEVTWEFVGGARHNVVGDGWGSDILREGTYSHQFDQSGTFDYVCTLHAGMDGRVIVTDEGGAP